VSAQVRSEEIFVASLKIISPLKMVKDDCYTPPLGVGTVCELRALEYLKWLFSRILRTDAGDGNRRKENDNEK